MYTLYYFPGACSLAVQVVLRELNLSFELIDKNSVTDFEKINPTGTVPVLVNGDEIMREGAATLLYLLDKHRNNFITEDNKQEAVENIMFANATIHPAYSKMFFLERIVEDQSTKEMLQQVAADKISKLWAIVEDRLSDKPFLGGESISVADILLAVYSRWGQFFPANITIGAKAQSMIDSVIAMPSFQQAIEAEQHHAAAA